MYGTINIDVLISTAYALWVFLLLSATAELGNTFSIALA